MMLNTFITSIACLSSLTTVLADNEPDKAGAHNVVGVGLDTAPTASKGSAASAPTGCAVLPRKIDLVDGRFLDIVVTRKAGPATYRMAIDINSNDTYLLSQKFCQSNALAIRDSLCYEGDEMRVTSLSDGIDIQGSFTTPIRMDTIPTALDFSIDGIELSEVSVQIVQDFKDPGDFDKLSFLQGLEDIQGVLGLGPRSPFLDKLATVCGIDGSSRSYGLRFGGDSGSFVLGGYDADIYQPGNQTSVSGNHIVIDSYVIDGESYSISDKIERLAVIDSVSRVMLLPRGMYQRVSDAYAEVLPSGLFEKEDFLIQDSEMNNFSFSGSALFLSVKQGQSRSNPVFGIPFLQSAYITLEPETQDLKLTSFDSKISSSGSNLAKFGKVPTTTASPTEIVANPSNVSETSIAATSTSSGAPNTASSSTSAKGANIGAIVGGVIGGLAAILLILLAGCCLIRRRQLTYRTARSRSNTNKQFEAEFDTEIGNLDRDLDNTYDDKSPNGYATIPSPPPPSKPFDNSTYLPSTDYSPGVVVYHDEVDSRATTPTLYQQIALERPASSQDHLSSAYEPSTINTPFSSPGVSRNVSVISTNPRRNYPSISQIQGAGIEEDDDEADDSVSLRSGDPYSSVNRERDSYQPRLPFRPVAEEGRESPAL